MKFKYLLGLCLAITLPAHAAQAHLVCKSAHPVPHSVVLAITVNEPGFNGALAGSYAYSEKFQGAYPTENEFNGAVSGVLSHLPRGIEARFNFVAFGVPSQLQVHQSVGTLIIGQDATSNDLQCLVW